ncbi:MAG: hypothetical protein Fur0041_20220 [Bacteroidia bacterium]
MSSENLFNAWFETQKQIMDNWTESAKKMQAAATSNNPVESGFNAYKEWLDKQAEITKKATEEASGKLNEQMKNAGAAFNPSNDLTENFNKWMKAQQDMMNNAWNQFSNFQPSWMKNNDMFAESKKVQEQMWNNTQNWMQQSNQMMQQWMAPYQNWTKQFTDNNTQDAWKNMLDMNTAYTRFIEMWQPVMNSMKNNQFSAEWMKNAFNPEMFKDMMDRTISMMSPNYFRDAEKQWENWFEVANNYNKHVYEQFSNMVPEQFKSMFPAFASNFDMKNPYANFFSLYQRSVSPLVRLFNPGKETEINENLVIIAEKTMLYNQKVAELQQHMYVTGAKNWENFQLENFELMKKGVELNDMQDMFRKWVAKNEEAFINLFQSEAYSKLQGELLDLSMEIKQKAEKTAEFILQPLPVVLRSEADELSHTIYELRKRVAQLEKHLNAETAEEKPAKAAKKKTATV